MVDWCTLMLAEVETHYFNQIVLLVESCVCIFTVAEELYFTC